MPGEVERVLAWFRDYKLPDGKPPSAFGRGGAPLRAASAAAVVAGAEAAYGAGPGGGAVVGEA